MMLYFTKKQLFPIKPVREKRSTGKVCCRPLISASTASQGQNEHFSLSFTWSSVSSLRSEISAWSFIVLFYLLQTSFLFCLHNRVGLFPSGFFFRIVRLRRKENAN